MPSRPKGGIMATIIRTTLVKSLSGQVRIGSVTVVPARGIAGRILRESRPKVVKPPPFDYVNKDYGVFRALWDKTSERMDENSKVIVVEGPIAVGKTEFAKKIAEDLDMKHYPEADMDLAYKRENGVDLREFDHLVPPDTRTFDHTNFCKDPKHWNTAAFQLTMLRLRFQQYVDALTHLFNTGQGVVLERSPYSDFVFMEAMYKAGYVSPQARTHYYKVKKNTIEEVQRPHLIIYLDIPVETVKQRIKERNLPYEVNSTVFTDEYLKNIEYEYKYKYLKEMTTHTELLAYDWTGRGDTEVVIEDIERLDLEQYKRHDEPKLSDWRFWSEEDYQEWRMIYTNGKSRLMNNFNLPVTDAPELVINADDGREWEQIVLEDPRMKYDVGYNAAAGDTGILFKMTRTPKYSEHF